MMLRTIGRCLLSTACLLAATGPASAQGAFGRDYPWHSGSHLAQFEPSYLVLCVPSPTTVACPADGMALLPSPASYTNLSLRMLGGPFTQRWQVENMRAALVRQGMPSHAMYVFVVNSAGQTVGGFWLGARPTCVDLYAQAPLTGELSGNWSPTGARPDTMPVSEDVVGAYLAHVEQIRPQCEQLARTGRPSTIPQRDGTLD